MKFEIILSSIAHFNVFKWNEQQPESDVTELVLLKRIKDLAAKKWNSVTVQKKIEYYFKTQLILGKY